MAIRIEWDEFEIALLIEACEEVLRKGKPKSEVVKTVSSNLRKRAISKNIAIDDVFRNENGIALQMQKMAYLLTHGEKGMPGASKLYAEVAELREENPKKFEEILKRAKEEIEMTDLSQQNIDKKALFAQWLNEHPIKKYTPSAIIDALDVASRYCVSKKVCKDGFWSMQNKAEFNAATSKLLSFRLFRLKYRSAAAKMDKAIPLYKAFLDSYVASREENTAEFEGEALNEPDSMLSTAAANSDDIIRLDFSDIGSLIFSKPVCLNYKDHTFTDFNSWASLYAKVAFLLKQDYPQIIVDGGSLSEGAAPEFSMNSKALRKPKAITDGLFIETNHSATEIASRIATLLRLCGVDLNKVSITYTLKKEAEQKRTSQARSENEKLYEKLYSISRIYDDPAGLSLNRITGLLGQSDDRELVQGILDHAPWAHRIENGIYSFASADTISARNEKKAGKDDTISDSAFYDYLDKTLCMAEPTCRSYVSAIRSAEKYAKDYGFTSYRIYDVTTSDAVALLNALMKDDGFAAYNIRQHNRFRAAFTKFAEMAGQSIAVKKTGAQLQNKPQEQPIAPFDKEKYIEILMCRYRNGITFDSIDFDNFRETYEDLYDSSIDADDDTLEQQLRLCGVFYNNRLFPAEGIMDDETREKLFTYIENSFSSGKKVLYYKAVFEDLADAFANCYSLADEHIPKKEDWMSIKNRIVYENQQVQLLTRISIDINIKTGEISFAIPDFGVSEKETMIEPSIWETYKDELVKNGETWGIIKLGYRPPDDTVKPRLSGKIKLVGFKNFCPYTVDLDYYKEMRSHFTIDEWIDVLLGAIDYNADPVTYLSPDSEGMVVPEQLSAAITDRTRLVSIMFSNNEIGTIEPIAELARIAHSHGAIFHTDAVQAIAHTPIDVKAMGIDMLSASAHKFNGPKGIGFLYVRKGVELRPLNDGGAQEFGMRAGTENVASIVGMAKALEISCSALNENAEHILKLENALLERLKESGLDFVRNGARNHIPGNISVSFKDADGEAILHRLDLMGICVSTGSACDSVSTQISHVLKAIKLKDNYARGTIRISFGKENTFEEANIIAESLIRILKK